MVIQTSTVYGIRNFNNMSTGRPLDLILLERNPFPSSPQVSFKILFHIILSYRHLSSGGSSDIQEIMVNLSLCFITQHAMKANDGVDGRTALLFLYLDSRWKKKMFSFTAPPLYFRGRNTGIHSIQSLGGPQSRSGCCIGKTKEEM